jgi:isopentenyl-diphosphate delta-isomerase
MRNSDKNISQRKKEHLQLCLTEEVSFRKKSTGFEDYEFVHFALTEVDINAISLETKFFKKQIQYPFLISCMTGGTRTGENINAQLALAAEELKIAVGVGSQRHALENESSREQAKLMRKNAPTVPIIGNIGAAQVAKTKDFSKLMELAELVEADAMAVHLNPAQELFQPEGEVNFKGLLKNIESLVKHLPIPVIVKEVGCGISGAAAKLLLQAGVSGIDTAGAGGTSWTAVEMLRSGMVNEYFWDWGIPTSVCIKEAAALKKDHSFMLIGSGGINSPIDAAKAFALGADIAASARTVLLQLDKEGVEGVIKMINDWFQVIKKIMFLTGSSQLTDLKNNIVLRERS